MPSAAPQPCDQIGGEVDHIELVRYDPPPRGAENEPRMLRATYRTDVVNLRQPSRQPRAGPNHAARVEVLLLQRIERLARPPNERHSWSDRGNRDQEFGVVHLALDIVRQIRRNTLRNLNKLVGATCPASVPT